MFQAEPNQPFGRRPNAPSAAHKERDGQQLEAADIYALGVHVALSIAGSDPTGGAGIQLDLRVFQTLGLHGAGVITALTVQDRVKVHQTLPVFPSVVLDQIRVLLRDQTPSAIKLGMLATDDVLRAVALGLQTLDTASQNHPPLVIDPVLNASDGTVLLERRAWGSLIELFPLTTLVTPNLSEATELTKQDTSSESGIEKSAAVFIEELGAKAVLVTGGHIDGPPDDLLAENTSDGISLNWFRGQQRANYTVHGTGCALSSAITAKLATGLGLHEAIRTARHFVHQAIQNATQSKNKGEEIARFLILS